MKDGSLAGDVRPLADRLFYLGAGPLLALLFGSLLVPLREVTPASNLAFFFVVLTIIMAALGGTAAGVATAFASGLSLNFFLTRPYLTLRIASGDDIIAVAGLVACGVAASVVGSPSRLGRRSEAYRHFDLLSLALEEVAAGGPAAPAMARVLAAARTDLPVRDMVVRDARDQVVASTVGGAGLPGEPPVRTDLVVGNRMVGSLSVWRSGGETEAHRRTLAGIAGVLAILLERAGRS
jgi:hypothetical protein